MKRFDTNATATTPFFMTPVNQPEGTSKRRMDCKNFSIDDILDDFNKLKVDDPYSWLQSLINSDNITDQKEAVVRIRKLLAVEQNHPTQELVEAGVIPFLIGCMQKYSEVREIVFEAAWGITNISGGNSDQTMAVVTNGAVEILISLLDHPCPNVREQGVWALGNVAGESADCRDFVIKQGLVDKLVPLIDSSQPMSFLRVASWCLSNICGLSPQSSFLVTQNLLPTLATLLRVSDVQVVTDTCWALFHISKGVNAQVIDEMIKCELVMLLTKLLDHSPNITHPALKTLGHVCCGNHGQTQHALDQGLLSMMCSLLGDRNKCVRREACWTLSNITAGTVAQIEDVINARLIHPLVTLMREDVTDVAEEACWALANAVTGGRDAHIVYLVEQEDQFLETLCMGLSTLRDTKTVSMLLTALDCILQTTHGVSTDYKRMMLQLGALKALAGLINLHSNDSSQQSVCSKAQRMVDRYFSDIDVYRPSSFLG